jgi:hypothetical protein
MYSLSLFTGYAVSYTIFRGKWIGKDTSMYRRGYRLMYVDNIHLREANKITEKKILWPTVWRLRFEAGTSRTRNGYPLHKDVRSLKRECYVLNLRFQNSYGVTEKDHVVGTASIWLQIWNWLISNTLYSQVLSTGSSSVHVVLGNVDIERGP